jgi:AcrR family transcriptional regulator
MSGIRAEKKRQTRQAIIAAAVSLFAEKGFDQTSMDELARAAGVGKGTIYGYFANKSEIFLAFCEEEIDFAFARLQQQTDPQAPLLEQLVALHLGQFDFVTANHEFGRIFCREMLFPAPGQAAVTRELDDRYLRDVGVVLQRAQDRGELRADALPLLTIGHFHALYILVLSSWYSGRFAGRDEVAAVLRALFIQALDGLGSGSSAGAADRELLDRIQKRFFTDAAPASGDPK